MAVQHSHRNWPWLKGCAAAKYLNVSGTDLRQAAEQQILKPGMHWRRTAKGRYEYDVEAIQNVFGEFSRLMDRQAGVSLKTRVEITKECTQWTQREQQFDRAMQRAR